MPAKMDAHLALTSSDPSDIPRPNISLEFDQNGLLTGPQEDMNFALEDHAAGRYPLARWYMNDGPWAPLLSGTSPHGSQIIASDMGGNGFVVPARRAVVPSEVNPISDSGYGTCRYQSRPSIANGSVCDEAFGTSQDAQSVMGGSMIGTPFALPDTLAHGWPNPGPIPIQDATLICGFCNQQVKTRSELKKHHQRHTKPFKCDVDNCRRGEGFSTVNDLDRHKRSVHPDSQTTGNRYMCPHGACRTKDKIWPRADNFKAHLMRVHKENVTDGELQKYIVSGQPMADGAQESSKHGTGSDCSEHAGATAAEDTWPPPFDPIEQVYSDVARGHALAGLHIPTNAPPREIYRESVSPDLASHSTMTPLSSPHPPTPLHEPEGPELTSAPTELQVAGSGDPCPDPSQTTTDRTLNPGVSDRPPVLGLGPNSVLPSMPIDSQEQVLAVYAPDQDISSHNLTESENGTISVAEALGGLDLNTVEPDKIKRLLDAFHSHGLLEPNGYRKASPQPAEPKKAEAGVGNNPSRYHYCPTCNKRFPRKCELTKHEKRHEKPYGCTSPGCDKKFGSKNDWKRHENTQHYMVEMWRCDERRDGRSDKCEKVVYRREQFKSHLDKEHQISDSSTVDAKLETCRVGRNCEKRYWCGFCQEIVDVKEKGGQAWSERFDHIAEHFSGRNSQAPKDIKDWKNFDPSQPSKNSSGDESDEESVSRSSTKTAEAGRTTGHANPKRKRGPALSNTTKIFKRPKREIQGTICCSCGDLITLTQVQCCNHLCQHKPCGDCVSTHKG